MIKRAELAFLALAAGGCAFSAPASPPHSVAELLGSAANVELVRKAGQAELRSARSIEMIKDAKGQQRTPDVLTPGNQTSAVTLSPGDIRDLKQILLDEVSYEWATSHWCHPTYTVELRFHTSDGPLAVALCFGCNQALWSKGKATLGSGDLRDSAAERIFQIVRRARPDDPVNAKLAALRAQRQ